MEAAIARGIQLLVALGGAYLLALWFALIVWTFQDIQTRSRSVIAQIFSTLVVVLFFLPGILIYLILRPRDTLDDAFQRSLEEEYLLQDLDELLLCPNCQRQVESDFVFCPHCRISLRSSCVGCGRLIDLRWDICPFCGEEQYPEESEVAIAEPWQPAEHEGVGRLLGQARERIAGYRAKALDRGARPVDQFSPVEPWTERTSQRTSDWDLQEHDAVEYRDSDVDPYGPNGRGADEWPDDPDPEPGKRYDRTDELPSGRPRR